MDVRPLRALLTPVVFVALLAGCTPATAPSASPTAAPPPVGGSVISTGDNTNQMVATLPQALTDQWNALQASGKGVEWLSTPNTTDITRTQLAVGGDASQGLIDRVNAAAGAGTDRSVLAALNDLDSPAGSPVWVFSPLLDTRAPLDFNELAFDEPPGDVVKEVKKAKALPDLKGREISFVINPVAGEQVN